MPQTFRPLLLCPCCRAETSATARGYGTSICPVCFWEDDPNTEGEPRGESSVNGLSLLQARSSFLRCGAVKRDFADLTRPAAPSEMPRWPLRSAETGEIIGKRMTQKSDWVFFLQMTLEMARYDDDLIGFRKLFKALDSLYAGMVDLDREFDRLLSEPIRGLDMQLGLMSGEREQPSQEDRAYIQAYTTRLRTLLTLP